MKEHRADERLHEAFARLSRTIEPLVPGAERFLEQTARRRARVSGRVPGLPDAGIGPMAPVRTARAPSLGPRVAVASLAAALTVAALWTAWRANQSPLGRRDEHRGSAALDLIRFKDGLWRAPTDFLLDVPGAELLRTTPGLSFELPTIPARVPSDPDRTHGSPSARRFST